MKILSTQNLNECKCGQPFGSKFWHGRAWLRTRREIHWEWSFGKYARGFAATASFGNGDNDDGLLLHLCIPFLFSIYLGIAGVYRCKECKTGVAIHNGGIWFYPLSWTMESNRSDPWWRHAHSWYFPWTYDWHSTEILEHKANLPGLADVVWSERRKDRQYQKDPFTGMKLREIAEQANSETYPYTYRLNNGKTQKRTATVYVDRMTWRMRWWPLLPFKKVQTCISVRFSDEVGEGAGSWKGGCTGCGYEMRFGETPRETLERMEIERRFDR